MQNNISDKINKMFEALFKTPNNEHPMFKDLQTVNSLAGNYRNYMEKHIKKVTSYSKEETIPDGIKITPNYDVRTKEDMVKLEKEIKNVLNFTKILELVSLMSRFVIKSNITNEEKLYTKMKEDNIKNETINIMIIGSGPVGLFLGCYLSLYYNNTRMNSYPRINVVIYDSRIENPGFRKPYNRQRLFGTSSEYLSLLIPKIYCWSEKNSKDYIMVNIFMLEYILYVLANLHYNIPIIYEDYNWDDYKKIIDKGKFEVVFDCTGGKLYHDAIKNINPSWLKNIPLTNKKLNRKLDVYVDKNLVVLNNDSKHIVNFFYASMSLFYNNETLTFYDKFDVDIMNKEDLMFFNKLKNKYFTYKDTIDIIKGIKDNMVRNFLYTMIHNYKETSTEYLITFDVWGIYIRHAIKISDVFNVNNRKILFIGAGDTIFHSHFLTGAGLNRTLDFSVKCSNIISQLRN